MRRRNVAHERRYEPTGSCPWACNTVTARPQTRRDGSQSDPPPPTRTLWNRLFSERRDTHTGWFARTRCIEAKPERPIRQSSDHQSRARRMTNGYLIRRSSGNGQLKQYMHREDLAAFMVGQLTEDTWVRKCVAIGYSSRGQPSPPEILVHSVLCGERGLEGVIGRPRSGDITEIPSLSGNTSHQRLPPRQRPRPRSGSCRQHAHARVRPCQWPPGCRGLCTACSQCRHAW